jgi:hypothetical protein
MEWWKIRTQEAIKPHDVYPFIIISERLAWHIKSKTGKLAKNFLTGYFFQSHKLGELLKQTLYNKV